MFRTTSFAALFVALATVLYQGAGSGTAQPQQVRQTSRESNPAVSDKAEPLAALTGKGARGDGTCKVIRDFVNPEDPDDKPKPAQSKGDVKGSVKVDGSVDLTLRLQSSRAGESPKPCGKDLDYLIALVPDPVNTHLSLTFDKVIESLQGAAAAAGYQFDRYYFPWKPELSLEEGDLEKRTASRMEKERLERYPGVLLFRNRCGSPTEKCAGNSDRRDLALFLVAETPTRGLNHVEFDRAVSYIWDLSGGKSDQSLLVKIIGPNFSGSASSLIQAMQKAPRPPKAKAAFDIYNGSATADRELARFAVTETKNPWTFSSFVHRDGPSLRSFAKLFGGTAVILTENETAFGALQGDSVLRTIQFPRDISHLRNAAQSYPEAPPVKNENMRGRQLLPFNLREVAGGDSIPALSAQTASAQEAVLANITRELNESRYMWVGIQASDPLDTIFLSRIVHEASPNSRLFVQDSDLLYLRAAADSPLEGTLSITYERQASDPVYRPLRIFTRDPATSILAGAVALVNVPYEPLGPGPEGSLFRVDGALDLNQPTVLIGNGLAPTMSDSAFRNQMAYAVCSTVYASFRTALGRHISWGFDREGNAPAKLIVRTKAFEGANAYYEKRDGTLSFGFYTGDEKRTTGNNLPGGVFYTGLSHDVIAHEVTHALLDGLRSKFTVPTGPDVLAFHEAFADLIAVFQRFTYSAVVRAAIREAGTDLSRSAMLTNIAEQFGRTTSGNGALRTVIEIPRPGEALRQYGADAEPHARGSVLTAAVFEAFNTVFMRKTAPLLRLATNGTGILPPGDMPVELQDLLAKEASQLGSHFLSILIRAIDYCPPVDIRFGDFLRALITADFDLVPDDKYAYREALIDAFRRRRIFPAVENLSEDALLWRSPRHPVDPIEGLNFANLRFNGDPQNVAGARELQRQARCLGNVVCRPGMAENFGLVSSLEAARRAIKATPPVIESIRSTRRIGPDGQIAFDLVAEFTQQQTIVQNGQSVPFLGGSTVILGPHGQVRYVIGKSVVSKERIKDQVSFVQSSAGMAFWERTRGGVRPKMDMLKRLHEV